ncbi:MAG: diguanylate cyclase domain-containing protein, partial [Methylohalobius sp.]
DRLKVGIAHHKVGLKLKWYSGSYAWFLVRLLAAILHQESLSLAEKTRLLGALIKIVFFDLGLAIETYVEADRCQLERMKTHLQRILDAVPEAILTLTTEGNIQTWNPAAERLFDRPQAKLCALPIEQLLADELGRPLRIHELLTHLWHPGGAPLPALAVKNQAQAVPVEITIAPLPEDPPRYLLVVRDVSRQKQAEAKLLQLAKFDSLTALPNRTLFLDRLAQELARSRRYRSLLAVLFLDLDDFKQINDSFGHLTGDLLLKQVALRLKGALRETDTIARFGGDEFTFYLPDLKTPEGYLPIVTKLLEAFASPFRLET